MSHQRTEPEPLKAAWHSLGKSQVKDELEPTEAIAFALISIAETLSSIDKKLTYLAEVIELKGQSQF